MIATKRRVELGDRVKDVISGVIGIAVARTEWLFGCERIDLQPEEQKDGKPADSYWLDEPQVEVLKPGAVGREGAVAKPVKTRAITGGTREDPVRRADPKR